MQVNMSYIKFTTQVCREKLSRKSKSFILILMKALREFLRGIKKRIFWQIRIYKLGVFRDNLKHITNDMLTKLLKLKRFINYRNAQNR